MLLCGRLRERVAPNLILYRWHTSAIISLLTTCSSLESVEVAGRTCERWTSLHWFESYTSVMLGIWGCSTILALAMGIDLYQILLFLGNILQIKCLHPHPVGIEPPLNAGVLVLFIWALMSKSSQLATRDLMKDHMISPFFGYTREIGIPSQRLSGLDRNISAML